MSKIIFVVDDNDTNLSMAKEALKEQYRVMPLPSAAKMFTLIEKITPDLILLDIEMPDIDGFEALSRLKANNSLSDIPVIFLTSMTDSAVEARGFQLGVVDFISKPFSAPVLLNRIKSHLDIDELIRERTAQLHQKTEQLQTLQNGIVFVLSDMVESRDKNTGGHIERTTAYINVLLEEMLAQGIYADEIEKMNWDLLVSSARLHDIGKIAISDNILNKPAQLNDEEFVVMKSHVIESTRIIDSMISKTADGEFLQYARMLAGFHHERWDGKGYPAGLEKENIPLLGRVMAIADVYDALVSERPYKKAFDHDKAVSIIMEGKGTQFDPVIVDIFFKSRERFHDINNQNKEKRQGESL